MNFRLSPSLYRDQNFISDPAWYICKKNFNCCTAELKIYSNLGANLSNMMNKIEVDRKMGESEINENLKWKIKKEH